ncbi:MAG: hypothetical protein PVH12_00710 [Candidatus Bathyarchaeota archaeon]|jgi:hypothetical protein
MPIPKAMVTRFFQFLAYRHLTDAKQELERIKEKMHKSEWNKGYYRALRGMLIEQKSDTGIYAFLSELDFNDKKALKDYRKEFQTHVKNELHEDYDRGYFSAWAECMRVLSRLAVDNPEANDETGKGQKRIEIFFKRRETN